ncbi:DUF4145 domain-containing protein [Pantoea anthophila]|uniref:DUF4145 domain-containing protein n=1 Tax=Pantoea anthophila TaxID=470931 RepID=UPI002DB8B02C|nr:DUF4145 domain-containing protein [Pantoea anthophila]MEB5708366.1 DUF4145 domain-containing protein [Pantoea anthophila]MEB6519212.1 DUF4145 domain-containing protein [Pantoea anthophila]
MSWVCPHCNVAAVIRDNDWSYAKFDLNSSDQAYCFNLTGITCPNPACNEAVITLEQIPYWVAPGTGSTEILLHSALKILPIIPSESKDRAKKYPSYIPVAILNDYKEACAIVDLSPKASATLARRCLQGMLRDYWGVNGRTLHDEILAIEDKVDPVVWDAILNVKSIGNIGAHMERDINLIIDVNPEEAELLIQMIEMLIEDWYVARHNKQQKLLRIKEIAEEKAQAKKA